MTARPTICQRTLESYLSGDAPLSEELQDHLDGCDHCAPLAQEFSKDREQLRHALAAIRIPPPPALEFRDALQSASGFRRRISLTVIPMLLLVLLAGALIVALAVVYRHYNKREQGAISPGARFPIEAPLSPEPRVNSTSETKRAAHDDAATTTDGREQG